MTDKEMKTTLLALLGGGVMLLAFIVGFLIVSPGRSAAPVAPSEPVDAPAVAQIETPPAPVGGGLGLAAPAPAVVVDPGAVRIENATSWIPMANGCAIEQIDAKIHISGTNNVSGWGHGNGIVTVKTVPEGDFFATVDFMVPQFTGTNNALVYLRAHGTDGTGKMVAILYQPRGGYQVQGWASGGNTFSQPRLASFGDEARVFHRMKLKYNAADRMAYGWVDDKYIGSLSYTLVGTVKFELFANTDSAGAQIDLRFENLTCSSDTSGAPPVPVRTTPTPTPSALLRPTSPTPRPTSTGMP